jgi:hypothetical protein
VVLCDAMEEDARSWTAASAVFAGLSLGGVASDALELLNDFSCIWFFESHCMPQCAAGSMVDGRGKTYCVTVDSPRELGQTRR